MVGRVGAGGILVFATICLWSVVREVMGPFAFFTGQPFHKPDLDPAITLREKTGLGLPVSAKVVHFDYEMAMDDIMTLRFVVSKTEAQAFMKQKVLMGWQRHTTSPDYPSVGWDVRPKAPYQEVQVNLPLGRFMGVIVEEKASGPWTVWMEWNET